MIYNDTYLHIRSGMADIYHISVYMVTYGLQIIYNGHKPTPINHFWLHIVYNYHISAIIIWSAMATISLIYGL